MIRLRAITLLTSTALAIIANGYAWAQGASVSARTGEHGEYSRLVFDWPGNTGYSMNGQDSGTLTINFNQVATLDTSALGAGAASNVKAMATTSAAGENLAVAITKDAASRVRDFRIGNKIIIDVFNPPSGDARRGRAASAAAAVPQAAPSAPAVAAPKAAPARTEKLAVDVPVQTAAPVAPAPTAIEKAIASDAKPHVITMSATEQLGVAAFERGGYLWLVIDRPMNVPPQISGPSAEAFGDFERMEVTGGAAYRLKLPDLAEKIPHFYGEGGGLVWRVVMTPNERDDGATKPERVFDNTNPARGGTLTFPMAGAGRVLDVADPSAGDVIKVVTVPQASLHTGAHYDFVDVTLLNSPIGMAAVPKTDDVKISNIPGGVQISRDGGLAISRASDVSRSAMRAEDKPLLTAADVEAGAKLYDFDRWLMGGIQALGKNQTVLLASMADKDDAGKVQDLLTLAKMNLANERGQESLGYLNFAADMMPAILESPEFMALRGAAHALAGKPELAFRDLQVPSLKDFKEVDPWRSYTLASLGDWQQAKAVLPADLTDVAKYPQAVQEKLIPRLAEVRLRGADVKGAQSLLTRFEKDNKNLKPQTQAAMEYLKGEALRQSKDPENAEKTWSPLLESNDDFYRVRAGLALTALQLEQGKITPDQAIDRLEGLRYTWRGDELEAQINSMLGRMYIEKDDYMKGFTILRDAVGMAPESDISKDIAGYMSSEFNDLLMNDKDLTAMDAVMVYEEFRELTPPGDAGNKLVQRLAERLVDTDLLGRASDLLQHQVDYRLGEQQKADVAIRLAAVSLLDDNPDQAVKALETAKTFYDQMEEGAVRAQKIREIDLLRARALLQLDRGEEAIALLNNYEPSPDVNRLRADIAWQGGLWEDAAEALQDLIIDEDMESVKSLSEYQADLILNRAVALNLSSNRVELANMRQRYMELMAKTSRGDMFDVVTRPRSLNMMTEQQTIMNIVGEVDMFKNFLDSYKNVTKAGERLTPTQ